MVLYVFPRKIGEFIVDYLKKIAIFQGTAWSPYDELGHYYIQ